MEKKIEFTLEREIPEKFLRTPAIAIGLPKKAICECTGFQKGGHKVAIITSVLFNQWACGLIDQYQQLFDWLQCEALDNYILQLKKAKS